jgi:potassium-transporting ATPase potassium-binding subunit
VNKNQLLQLLLYFGLLIALAPVLGSWLALVFERTKTGRLERFIYRLGGVNPSDEMSWKRYFLAVLVFNVVGIVALMTIEMTQAWLPLNPQKFPNVPWAVALNTAVSFITNTNWQAYSGESTMNYFTQMAGLAVHNFLSTATGIAVMLAMARGLKRASAKTIGNFWVDLTRATLYVLLPLSIVFAVVLVSQGVVQTFAPYRTVETLEGAEQVVPLGPAASQVAIKQLGTNGGGFFGQNSAHPFENPTPLSNFLEMLAILLLPAALVYTFGVMVGDRRHAWCLFCVMLALLLAGFSVAWWSESHYGTMEGKEVRFGVMNSVLWGTATTATSNGSVNSMHDSWSPLAGFVALWNIMLGEIIFGGTGSGMYGILLHVLLAVFIAGLMVGRTPEYLGKKIQAWEATWSIVGVLVPSALILIGAGIASAIPGGLLRLNNAGPHGLSEIFYAFSSAANNNGSAFAGLNANTPFYNLSLGACMLIGRFIVIAAALAIAGSLAAKKTVPASPGTFPTNGLTFAVVLLGIIVIVGALTFFPALCLGPIVEHGLMLAGRVF